MKLDYVVAGYVVYEDKVLLIFHPKLKMWLGVGGHIDPNETPDDAMIREAKEETNLDVVILPQSEAMVGKSTLQICALPFHTEVHSVGDHNHYCFMYACLTTDISHFKFEENMVGKWFSRDDLQTVDFISADIKKQAIHSLDIVTSHLALGGKVSTKKSSKSAKNVAVVKLQTTLLNSPSAFASTDLDDFFKPDSMSPAYVKSKTRLEETTSYLKENVSLVYSLGSDESLKGDTFGGIVVAGVAVTDELGVQLKRLGVDDSKRIPDERIDVLAMHIKQLCPHVIYSVYPTDYNTHTLTKLLNQLHTDTRKELSDSITILQHIVDEYPGCTAGTIRETKAESKYIEVAAASILARQAALLQIRELSRRAGFRLPLGSTHVSDALLKLKKSKLNPSDFVKMHFKNVKEALK
jgi:ribonuclease HIII